MAKNIQYYDDDGSIQQTQALPTSLATEMDNASDITSDTAGPMIQHLTIATGATATVGTWVAPYACEIIHGAGYKTGATSADPDKVELLAGATAIFDMDIGVVNEVPLTVLTDDSVVLVAKGDVLTWKRTQSGAADTSCKVWFMFVPQ